MKYMFCVLFSVLLISTCTFGESEEMTLQKAQMGDPEAQYKMGKENDPSITDYAPSDGHKVAFSWYQKAANQGHLEAQFALGMAHRYGRGTQKDPIQALRWLKKAAFRGDNYSMGVLGHMYSKGEGVERDLMEGYAYLRAFQKRRGVNLNGPDLDLFKLLEDSFDSDGKKLAEERVMDLERRLNEKEIDTEPSRREETYESSSNSDLPTNIPVEVVEETKEEVIDTFPRKSDAEQSIMPQGTFIDTKSNVRSGPGSDYNLLFVAPKGETFTVLEKKGRWYNVKLTNGQVGWTNIINIQLDNKIRGESRSGIFIDSESNVRSGPGSKYRILFVPKQGDSFSVLEQKGKWLWVSTASGKEGWTSIINIKLSNESSGSPSATKLSTQDLTGKSKWDLDIMRNEPYARHGYIFRREDLNNFFRKQSWYKPETSNMNIVEKRLSEDERYNSNLIIEWQKK